MATVPPPARPAVPPRPPVPSAAKPPVSPVIPAVPPVAQVPAPVAPTVPAPIVADTTFTAPVAVSAPPIVQPPAGVVPMTGAAPKKRGRKAGTTVKKKDLIGYHGLYVYDESGQVKMSMQKDEAGIESLQPQKQKIQGVPALGATSPPVAGDAGFDPKTMEQLKPRDFEKLGDYYRFRNQLLQKQIEENVKSAADADAGKKRQRGPKTDDALKDATLKLLQTLRAQCKDAAQYQAMLSGAMIPAEVIAQAMTLYGADTIPPAA